jgi:hypothetical protein
LKNLISTFLCSCFLTFIVGAATASANDDELTEYLNNLAQTATDNKLHQNSQWLALLHHKIGWLGTLAGATCDANQSVAITKSIIVDSKFFLAENGKYSAKDELSAAIFALNTTDISDTNPQCRFPSRYAWLNQQLHFDYSKIVKPNCVRFQEWFSAIAPESLTLVFPSAYINSPASAFGHTLIRINQNPQRNNDELLYYTASYSAQTNEQDSAPLYALKGLLGAYNGYFIVNNYYDRVNMYGDSENRDIWEYDLNLSKAEVEMLVANLWELREINIDYFYFDDNCAYILLALLEVARPELRLTEKFQTWITPVDSIKELTKIDGLIGKISFRPALQTKLSKSVELASDTEVSLAKKMSNADVNLNYLDELNLTSIEKAKVLDLAIDYLSYTLPDKYLGFDAYRTHIVNLLNKRSQIDVVSEPVKIEMPSIRPDEGHASSKLNLSSGYYNGQFSYNLQFNFAYHELLDPQGGFKIGSELLFFKTIFSYQQHENLKLNTFVPLQLKSYSPINSMLTPISWEFKLGMQRLAFDKKENHSVYSLGGGLGLTWGLGQDSMFYNLLLLDSTTGRYYVHDYAIGGGVKSGVLFYWTDIWATNFYVTGANYFLGDNHQRYELTLDNRFTLNKNLALKITLSQSKEYERNFPSAAIGLDWFF